MPLIPYPAVPDYPGVPAIVRKVASSTAVNLALDAVGSLLLNALQAQTQWGIYDSAGNELGGVGNLTFVESLVTQPTILSTLSFEFGRESRISDFPVEEGSFASYNKVQMPANPTVVLALSGSQTDRTAFLNALEVAANSTELYSVITPEIAYVGYSIERYRYSRRAERNATLLNIEIPLKEIREVSAAYTTTAAAPPIANPANVSAATQANGGTVQPTTPDTSTLLSLTNKLGALLGAQ